MEGIEEHVFHEDSRFRTDFLFDVGTLSVNFSNASTSLPNDSAIRDEFGSVLSVSVLQAVGTAVALGVIMIGTIMGNILVILSVFTYKPLRNVQNIFLVSLAAADIAVAVFVMPFNLAYSIMGNWVFGLHVCKLWLTCDVLCCTASILNLCAIALDRYWAIHDPIQYAQKRTLRRVLCMILCVWVISTLISVPPLIGWNDWPEVFTADTPCQLTEEKGYVIYSASGSFFIPLVIMTAVYVKIFQTARNRIRVKAKAAANIIKKDLPTAASISTCEPLRTISTATVTGVGLRRASSVPDAISGALKIVSTGTSSNLKTASSGTISDEALKTVSSGAAKDAMRSDSRVDIEVEGKSSGEIDATSNVPEEQQRRKKSPGNADGTENQNEAGTKGHSAGGTKASKEDGTKVDNNADGTKIPNECGTKCHSASGKKASNADGTKICGAGGTKTSKEDGTKVDNNADGTKTPVVTVRSYMEQKERICLQKERRAAQVLGIVMGVFVLCWLPFFLMYVILPFCESCYISQEAVNFITWLGYMNSALNPVIYTVFNTDFRRSFQRLLSWKFH